MAGSAYPHIIFAKNDETLPKEELENLLRELFSGHEPAPVVDHGVLEVSIIVDDYSFTFWYDDEAEGLGARYADYAPSLKQRRISRATTMIDFSGAPDPSGAHAETAHTIMQALAERSDVYVFSEQDKRFLDMDYDDPFATSPAPASAPAPTPAQQGTAIDSEEMTVYDPSSTGPKAGPDPHAPHSSQEHAENVNAAPTDPDGTPEDAPAVPGQVLAEPTMEQPAAAPQFEPVGLPVPAEEPAAEETEEPTAEESAAEESAAEEPKAPDTAGASAARDQEETAEEDTKWWKPATWFGRRK